MEVVFHGPIIVTKLDYGSYLEAHREEIERKRAEVAAAAAGHKVNDGSFTEKAENSA